MGGERRPGGQQAGSICHGDGCLAAPYLEFVAGIANMEVDGALGYAKNHADFPTCLSHRGPVQAFELGSRQRLHSVSSVLRRCWLQNFLLL